MQVPFPFQIPPLRLARFFGKAFCAILPFLLFDGFVFAGPLAGQSENPETKILSERRLSEPAEIQLGEVKVLRVSREIRFPCRMNLRKGLIEYALVGEPGKIHESVFMTAASPHEIHAAMLLLGARPHDFKKGPEAFPTGSPVEIFIQWDEDGAVQIRRMEEFILTGEPLEPLASGLWIYTGSKTIGERFMAALEHSIVAVMRDPHALVNTRHEESAQDDIWYVNTKACPPELADVTCVIRLRETPKDESSE